MGKIKKEDSMYCTKCGEKLIQKRIAKYDSNSGKPIYNNECPSDKFGHDGVFHNDITNPHAIGHEERGWGQLFFGDDFKWF